MNIYGRGVRAQINAWRQTNIQTPLIVNFAFALQEKPAETKKAKKDENGAGDDEEDVEGRFFELCAM